MLLKGGGIVGFTSAVELTEGATPRNGMKSTTYSKAVSPYLTTVLTHSSRLCYYQTASMQAERTFPPRAAAKRSCRAKLAHHKHKHKRATSCRICLAFPSSLSVTDIRTLHQSR